MATKASAHGAGGWLQPRRCLQTRRPENRRQPGAARWWDVEMSTLTPPVPRWDVSPPHAAAPLASWLFFPPPSLVLSPPSFKDLSDCDDIEESFLDSGVP